MRDAGKQTILLVEDEYLIAMAEQMDLEQQGYAVIHAPHGEKALEILNSRKEPIDLVLMDIDLGSGMDGTEAAQEILKGHDIPIVFLSSHTEKEIVEKTEKITSYGYVVKNSGEIVLMASIKMAFKLFSAHLETLRKDRILELSQKTAHMGSWEFELGTETTYWSDEFFRICGFEPRSFTPTAEEGFQIIHPDDLDRAKLEFDHAITTGQPYTIEMRIMRPDGSIREVQSVGEVIYNQKGEPEKLVGSFLDITDRKEAEKARQESFNLLSKLAEQVPGVIYQYRLYPDGSSKFPYASPGMWMIYEVTPEEVREDATPVFGRLHPDDYDAVSQAIFESARTQQLFHIEFRVILPVQGLRWRLSDAAPQLMEDGSTLWHGIISDITERKLAEQKVNSLLAEKELLLKEVHHRVKNSLNMAMSILSVHAASLESSSRATTALMEAKTRLQSMSMLYDKLYRAENIREMSVQSYLSDLVEEIIRLFPNKDKVRTVFRIDDFPVPVKSISTLGIIVNELITNSMKYAFRDTGEGIIRVSASRKENRVTIVIEDNGTGLPDGFSIENMNTFGLRLVYMLTEQINGTLRHRNCDGAQFTLEFVA